MPCNLLNWYLINFIELGYDGTQCTYTCPVTCGPGDQICNGGTDMNGCMMPDSCYPTMVKLYWIACLLLNLILTVQKNLVVLFSCFDVKNCNKAGECNQYCPATCGENELVCSSYDPTTSCPHPDSCMPATYKGKFI